VKNVFGNTNKPAQWHFAHQTQCILILNSGFHRKDMASICLSNGWGTFI